MGQSSAGTARRKRIVALATAGFMLAGLSATGIASADPGPQATTNTAPQTSNAAQTPGAQTSGAQTSDPAQTSETPQTSESAQTSTSAGADATTGAAAAVAQTSPPPAAPSTGGPGGGAKTGTVAHAAPFGHLPIIDIVPTFTQPYPVGSTAVFQSPLVNTGTGYQPIDIGGTFRLPILPWLAASFDRVIGGTLNVPAARVTTAENKYTIPTFSRDIVLQYRLDENFKRFQIEEGLYFRHRAVGGANTSNNPAPATTNSTEAHYGYIGFTYTTPGVAELLNSFLTFNINVERQAIDHHVGGCKPPTFTSGNFTAPCVGGVWDPNPSQSAVYETDQYVQLTIPFAPRDGVSLSAQQRWGALNFYENAAFPYRATSSQTYIFTKRFNRVFALSLRNRTQFYVPQGAPYVRPNVTHNGAFDVIADFKVDTNHLH